MQDQLQDPSCSLDSTPTNFFSWGFTEDRVYVPPLPLNLPELKDLNYAASAEVMADVMASN